MKICTAYRNVNKLSRLFSPFVRFRNFCSIPVQNLLGHLVHNVIDSETLLAWFAEIYSSVQPLAVNLIGYESVSLLARITARLKNKVKSEQQVKSREH